MHDVCKNTDEYNPDKENKTVIVFDDMIADMIHNKNLDSIVTELLIRGRKLNISLVFIVLSNFNFAKDVRLNTTHSLFYLKNPKQKRMSRRCNKSFIRH